MQIQATWEHFCHQEHSWCLLELVNHLTARWLTRSTSAPVPWAVSDAQVLLSEHWKWCWERERQTYLQENHPWTRQLPGQMSMKLQSPIAASQCENAREPHRSPHWSPTGACDLQEVRTQYISKHSKQKIKANHVQNILRGQLVPGGDPPTAASWAEEPRSSPVLKYFLEEAFIRLKLCPLNLQTLWGTSQSSCPVICVRGSNVIPGQNCTFWNFNLSFVNFGECFRSFHS